MEINLRKEFSEILKQYGFNVIHVSVNKYIKCSCYNELYNTGDSNCKICNGSGKLIKLNIIKVIEKEVINKIDNTVLGDINNITKDFYFEYNTKINNEDFILVVNFNKLGRAVEVVEVYEVKTVSDKRLERGRIEIKIVGTINRQDKIVDFNNTIRKNVITINKKRCFINGNK